MEDINIPVEMRIKKAAKQIIEILSESNLTICEAKETLNLSSELLGRCKFTNERPSD